MRKQCETLLLYWLLGLFLGGCNFTLPSQDNSQASNPFQQNLLTLNQFPLHEAVKQKDLRLVRHLLAEGYAVNMPDIEGFIPLHLAAREGYEEIAQLLLENGANPNEHDYEGYSPMCLAAWRGHIHIIKLLLAWGGDANIANQYGYTPLHAVTISGHLDLARELLARGADPNRNRTTIDSYTALHLAASRGYQEVVQVLLENGADPDQASIDGNTALHLAARYGHMEVINLLLQANACINTQNKNGNTFLHILADKQDAATFAVIEQSIDRVQSVFLNNLQESIIVLSPEVAKQDLMPIWRNIVDYDYFQAIDWELTNNQGKTIQDIRAENNQQS